MQISTGIIVHNYYTNIEIPTLAQLHCTKQEDEEAQLVETYHSIIEETITVHFLPDSLCHRRRHDYYL